MTGRICKSSHHRSLPIFIVVSVGCGFYNPNSEATLNSKITGAYWALSWKYSKCVGFPVVEQVLSSEMDPAKIRLIR